MSELACYKTKKAINDLLINGTVGKSMSCTGGFGSRYTRFIFVKINTTKIAVYQSHTWESHPTFRYQEGEKIGDAPTAWITKDKIIFRFNLSSNRNRWTDLYTTKALLTIGEFESDGRKIIPIKIRWNISKSCFECNNGIFLPQKKMIFNWDGDLLNPTKANIKTTHNWLESLRIRRNSMAKRNRDEKKAVNAFKYCREEGLLDQWDATTALSFKNAQLRQQAIEEVGLERVIGHLPCEILDKDKIDNRPYELIQFTIPNTSFDSTREEDTWNKKNIMATYLKMTNPSTGEYHLEGIPLKSDSTWDYAPEPTVRCALAWRDGEVSGQNRFDSNGTTVNPWEYTEPEILT